MYRTGSISSINFVLKIRLWSGQSLVIGGGAHWRSIAPALGFLRSSESHSSCCIFVITDAMFCSMTWPLCSIGYFSRECMGVLMGVLLWASSAALSATARTCRLLFSSIFDVYVDSRCECVWIMFSCVPRFCIASDSRFNVVPYGARSHLRVGVYGCLHRVSCASTAA